MKSLRHIDPDIRITEIVYISIIIDFIGKKRRIVSYPFLHRPSQLSIYAASPHVARKTLKVPLGA